jgi:signal transduction histidine kinase
MDGPYAPAREDLGDPELVRRLRWLLRLRWFIVPIFVSVDLANDLIMNRRVPWAAIAVGAGLLAANGVYALLLSRPRLLPLLVRFARLESAVVVAIPVAVVALQGDPANVLRWGVLVGVVGAAAVLPRSGEVAIIGVWAIAALIVSDAVCLHFDPTRLDEDTIARWAMEAGIIGTVTAIATYLHSTREWTARRLREATRDLERARGDFEATFDGVHEMVFAAEEGRVVRANRAFANAVGARPHDLAGRRLAEVLAGHPPRWWTLPADGITEIEDPFFDTVFEVTSTRLGTRVVHVARDVGEVRRLFARLVQADKLAGLGVLASGLAHEVNNPTAFVSSNLTEMKRYLGAYEAAAAEMTEIAMAAGEAERVQTLLARPEVALARREAPKAVAESLQGMERIQQIAANLRSVVRQDQAGERAAPVDLTEVLQAVARTAAADLRAASASVDAPGPVWVLGHRGELVDVVLNLVVNAIQSRDEARPNRVVLALGREGSSAVLRVSDTGRGIAPAHLKRLYEPFFTTKAPGEGTGLGLSLARKIVLVHGGSIDVATEVGVGSTFTVRLPAVDPDAPALRGASDVA